MNIKEKRISTKYLREGHGSDSDFDQLSWYGTKNVPSDLTKKRGLKNIE
jgi:hypothetical protein